MIKTANIIPQIYNTSFDFTLFEAVIDLICNGIDSRIPSLKGLHSPEQCFNENLGNLAAQFNLNSQDRDLLSKYRLMVKNKGTEKAVEAAIRHCGGEIVGTPTKEETSDGQYLVSYQLAFESFDHDLFDTLLRRVAPFNMQVSIEHVNL